MGEMKTFVNVCQKTVTLFFKSIDKSYLSSFYVLEGRDHRIKQWEKLGVTELEKEKQEEDKTIPPKISDFGPYPNIYYILLKFYLNNIISS